MFFVFEIFAFLAGKWRHELCGKDWLCQHGISNVTIWKNFSQGAQNWKKVLKYVYPIKRYDVLKCEFLLFLVTKWRKIQISKLDIFWVDRDISDFFSVLRSLWKVLSNGNIRYPMLAKPNFGTQFVTSFSRQKCKSQKKKNIGFYRMMRSFLVPSFRITE